MNPLEKQQSQTESSQKEWAPSYLHVPESRDLPKVEREILEALLKYAHSHLAYLDRNFNFLFVNPMYAKGSGYTPEELIGRNHFDLFPDEENKRIFEQVRDTGKAAMFHDRPFTYPGQPERGTTYWDWSLTPIQNEAGEVQGLVFSLWETTERKNLDDSLTQALEDTRRRQAEAQGLLKGARAILEHKDFQDVVKVIFDACKNLIGATAGYLTIKDQDEEYGHLAYMDTGNVECEVDPNLPMFLRGMRGFVYETSMPVYENEFALSQYRELIPEGHMPLENVLFAPLRAQGEVLGLLGLANKPGGFVENDAWLASAFGEIVAVAIRNQRAEKAVQEAHDQLETRVQERTQELEQVVDKLKEEIHERQLAEKELHLQTSHNAHLNEELEAALEHEQAMRNQLIQNEKFAAMGRVVASVAHELNNPLQTIENCLFLIKMKSPTDAPIQEFLEMASSETERLTQLVAQLRELYRPRNLTFTRVELDAVLQDVHTLLMPQLAKSSVRWVYVGDPIEAKVMGSPDQIKQVLINVCTNAIQAMQPKGGLLQVQLLENSETNQVGFLIKDTGPGIAPENISKLFEPFFTTKQNGFGLGLPICYEIIHRHGGSIEVDSTPGQGAAFTIWLPRKEL